MWIQCIQCYKKKKTTDKPKELSEVCMYYTPWPCWYVVSSPEFSRYKSRKGTSVNATCLKTANWSLFTVLKTSEYLLCHTAGWDQSTIFGRVWVSSWRFHLLGTSAETSEMSLQVRDVLSWTLYASWKGNTTKKDSITLFSNRLAKNFYLQDFFVSSSLLKAMSQLYRR